MIGERALDDATAQWNRILAGIVDACAGSTRAFNARANALWRWVMNPFVRTRARYRRLREIAIAFPDTHPQLADRLLAELSVTALYVFRGLAYGTAAALVLGEGACAIARGIKMGAGW